MSFVQQTVKKAGLEKLFHEARIGIEKESQRVTNTGALSEQNHPNKLGNRSFHPYIQTDFSETQMEYITPVANSVTEAIRMLNAIQQVAIKALPEEEILWPFSMPPALPENENLIKIAKLESSHDVHYRKYLAKEYGKRKQMISGIHYNFEFSKEFIQQLFENQTDYQTLSKMKSEVYLKVSRNYLRYRWLITYLYGASPTSNHHFFEPNEERVDEPVRSIRSSRFGYRNRNGIKASYSSVEQYVSDIQAMVNSGLLIEDKEFYSAVRLRGGKKVSDLTSGIHYIEVRNIDLNPFASCGIEERELRFIQLFLMYLLWIDEQNLDETEYLIKGNDYNNQVALEHPLKPTALQAEGERLLNGILEMLIACHGSDEDLAIVEQAHSMLLDPNMTLAGRLEHISATKTMDELGIELGMAVKKSALEKSYQLKGYEQMELSTQILMNDAIEKGIAIELLDEQDQFLKLTYQDHIEYVKNGNMTSKDNYIVPLIMKNKTVTKKLLNQAGFRVPLGAKFSDESKALDYYEHFKEKAIVIKPKSTNYGIGISIFKTGANFEDYCTAVNIAFSEDTSILVEEFLEGTEYRFFTIEGETKAVLLRVPANVTGDGIHTIAELVAIKNQDPLRGPDYSTPLHNLVIGDVEELMLKTQNKTKETVPFAGEKIYLRENSNVSTGGDSIDMTDQMDPSYLTIAGAATKSLGAAICGIDLIIPDANKPAEKNSNNYGIIEANFNPAMHMHIYPYQGKGRRLTMDVIHLLFPEMNYE